MITKLILLVCVYPFVLFMYFLLKNEFEPKKGLYYGVALDREQAAASEVLGISRAFNKEMRNGFIAILLLPLPAVFIPWFSIFMIFWLVWLVAGIAVCFIPFARANTRLKELKRAKGWKKNGEGERIVELKNAGAVCRVKWYHFLPESIISVGVFIWASQCFNDEKLHELSIVVGSFALITLLFWFAAIWMDGQKTQVISVDSQVNLNYARAKKNIWKNLWIICAWVNTVYTISLLWMLDAEKQLTAFFMIATVVYTAVVLAVLIWALSKKKKLDGLYRDRMDMVQPDDDDNWLWGMIYYNPKDKRSSVESRVGFGITTNMAKPAGKILVGFVVLVMLQMVLVSVWVVLLEFTPVSLRIQENRLVASQITEDYSVPVLIIEELSLVEELPKWSKVTGTGMEELLKGTFRIPEEGKCEVFLNPQNTIFLRFEAAGITYYMSGYNDAETLAVYEEILKIK